MLNTMSKFFYQRPHAAILRERLNEPRRFIQVVAGPRQVGKTTLVLSVMEQLEHPAVYASADEPALRGPGWLAQQWQRARLAAREGGAVLVIDEIQKAAGWAEAVKRLWDEDTRNGIPLQVVLLGSAPLLVQRGLSESLAGRFEMLYLPHWSLPEMQAAFGFGLEEFLFFGGYPGAAPLVRDEIRWRNYIREALIETTLSRDILLLEPVRKPALLRRLFALGCQYSGQILSYNKLLGQLQDAGNTTTLAHYLDLLCAAGMLAGLQKHAGQGVRRRGSSPKFQVFNTALFTAELEMERAALEQDPITYGRLVESAVGAHLVNAAAQGLCQVYYWREGHWEVDFVVTRGRRLLAIEVKSAPSSATLPGIDRFLAAFPQAQALLVGGEGMPLAEFLSTPVAELL